MMATTFGPPNDGYNYSAFVPAYTTGTTTATLVTYPVGSTVPAPKAKKQTPLEWLEDEVERVCAKTRPGLALS